ncbi:MAG: exo-alpha-sialidase [Bacteroidota bacterium]|nr:exo-alpha-sialidase [Bacteroidota bacterium]
MMLKNYFSLILWLLLTSLLTISAQKGKPEVKLFSPGIISTGMNERDLAISMDGKEYYNTVVGPKANFSAIVMRSFENNIWSDVEVLPFSGNYSDLEPAFSPDGIRLYFASNRPLEKEGKTKDFDIWYVQRKGKNAWGEPVRLDTIINSTCDEFYPCISKKGNLYFTAAYPEAIGQEDIYLSNFIDGQFQKPMNLGDSVNSTAYEFNAFVDPDEQFIIFSAYARADDQGGGDLYISHKNKDRHWGLSKNMGPNINSKKLDYCPYVSSDKKTFYFTSERIQDKKLKSKKISFKDVSDKINLNGNGLGDIYFINSMVLSK